MIFGALAAFVTLALVGQAIAREALLESEDYANLRVLGATRTHLSGIVGFRAGLVGVTGAVLALIVAAVSSPVMPVGLARQADIHPGIDFDAGVLVLGALVFAAAVTGWAVLAAQRVDRRSRSIARGPDRAVRGHASSRLAAAPVPPEAVIGIRLACDPGGGRTGVPVATSMLTAALSVTLLVAALTFGASLSHLTSSPRQQGWNWDVLVGNPNDLSNRIAQDGTLLAHDRFVRSYSAIAIVASQSEGTATIDNVSVPTLLAIDPLKGSVYPPLLQGHPPRADDQIVLGTQTLDKLHRRVGQSVHINTPSGVLTLHIVGRMIVPSVGDLFSNELGDGGWIYGPAVQQQAKQSQSGSSGASNVRASDGLRLVCSALCQGRLAGGRRCQPSPPVRSDRAAAVAIRGRSQPSECRRIALGPRWLGRFAGRVDRGQHTHDLRSPTCQGLRDPENRWVHPLPSSRCRGMASDDVLGHRPDRRNPARHCGRSAGMETRRIEHRFSLASDRATTGNRADDSRNVGGVQRRGGNTRAARESGPAGGDDAKRIARTYRSVGALGGECEPQRRSEEPASTCGSAPVM